MATLFYLIGIIFFVSEISILGNPDKHLKNIKLLKNDMPKEYDSLSDEQKSAVKFVIFGLFYFSWLVIGALFSSQWLMFVGLISFGFFIGFYRRRFYVNNTRKSLKVIKFDSFISAIWLATLILNHFHKFL